MPDLDGTEPIADDELILRRIPVSQGWFDPLVAPHASPLAFRPRDDDLTGLSVVRGLPYNTFNAAAQGPSKRGYYLAVFRAGDLRGKGIHRVPRPVPGIAGHAEITDLTVGNRDTDEARQLMVLLAHELYLRVEGPFPGA
jgi:hypothetical protein